MGGVFSADFKVKCVQKSTVPCHLLLQLQFFSFPDSLLACSVNSCAVSYSRISHVTSVSHASVTRLSGSMVLTGLQSDLAISQTSYFLFRKVSTIFRCHLGTNAWTIVFGMQLGLLMKRYCISAFNSLLVKIVPSANGITLDQTCKKSL